MGLSIEARPGLFDFRDTRETKSNRCLKYRQLAHANDQQRMGLLSIRKQPENFYLRHTRNRI